MRGKTAPGVSSGSGQMGRWPRSGRARDGHVIVCHMIDRPGGALSRAPVPGGRDDAVGRSTAKRQRRRPARHARAWGRCRRRHRHHRDRAHRELAHGGQSAHVAPNGGRHRRWGQRGSRAAGPGGRAGGRSPSRVCCRGARLHRRCLDTCVPAGRRALPTAHAGAVQRRGAVGVRHQLRGGRAVLLPRRPEALHRPRLLPRAGSEVRRAGRLRPGLRDRARSWPSPAGAARRVGAGERGPSACQRNRRQPPVGAARTAGGLLCWRVGQPRWPEDAAGR